VRKPSGQRTTPRRLPARLAAAASASTHARPALSTRVRPPRSSRVCAPAASVRAAAQSAAPGWIVLPHYSIDEPMELAPVSKGTAFMHLVDNAFNYDVHGRVGFALLADFVEASRCYTFTYNGDLKEAIDVFETLSRRK
jgi:hypothetical protein